jgi:hypothetical protein
VPRRASQIPAGRFVLRTWRAGWRCALGSPSTMSRPINEALQRFVQRLNASGTYESITAHSLFSGCALCGGPLAAICLDPGQGQTMKWREAQSLVHSLQSANARCRRVRKGRGSVAQNGK